MALDATADALAIASAMDKFIADDTKPGDGMMVVIAKILDDGFQKAAPEEVNVDISVAAGTLIIPFTGTGSFSKILGLACATYWSSATGAGTAIRMAAVTGVVNDASKIATAIEANINALATGSYLSPEYYDFVNAIHKEVLTIVWTVSESGPGSSSIPVKIK